MNKLIITRGLPASGKTTLAQNWVAEDPGKRARVNRDDLRAMLNNSVFIKGVTEQAVIAVRNSAIMSLLGLGLDVICDDTNLPQRTARDLRNLATRAGAEFDVKDLTHIPVDTCIQRDHWRKDKPFVGHEVITDMYERYIKGRITPLPLPEESETSTAEPVPYTGTPGKPTAIIVDVDGTVALKGARDPFDESTVHQDRPNLPVITAVRAMEEQGYRVIFMSGRTDACYSETAKWLDKHIGLLDFELWMRKKGDYRKDATVKMEFFDQHVRDRFDVAFVLDDRDQVVDMWRSLGLTCMQVAPGNF